MLKACRKLTVLTVVALLSFTLVAAPAAWAADAAGGEAPPVEYTGKDMVIDAAVLRPFGVIATIFGSALFVVSLPFSIPGGNVGKAAEKLVVDPFNYTFRRPLGQIP